MSKELKKIAKYKMKRIARNLENKIALFTSIIQVCVINYIIGPNDSSSWHFFFM